MKKRVVLSALLAGSVATGVAVLTLGGEHLSAAEKKSAPGTFKETRWHELTPKDWDPVKVLQESTGGRLNDDPASQQQMRVLWDNAPTVSKLDGAALKLPGYVVPLEEGKDGMKEFLLVPYFGACLHSPPPPANQIVHVVAASPVKGFKAMDTVWVSGTISTSRNDSHMGVSGYKMTAAKVDRYEATPRK